VQDFSPAHTKPSNTLLLQYSLKIPWPSPKTLSIDTSEIEEEDDEGDDVVSEKDVHQFGTEHFGLLARPYVTPYVYNGAYLDRFFGIRKDDDGQCRIGNSLIKIDKNSNVVVQGRVYKGTKG
jgi:hypothetical protein